MLLLMETVAKAKKNYDREVLFDLLLCSSGKQYGEIEIVH